MKNGNSDSREENSCAFGSHFAHRCVCVCGCVSVPIDSLNLIHRIFTTVLNFMMFAYLIRFSRWHLTDNQQVLFSIRYSYMTFVRVFRVSIIHIVTNELLILKIFSLSFSATQWVRTSEWQVKSDFYAMNELVLLLHCFVRVSTTHLNSLSTPNVAGVRKIAQSFECKM